MGGRLYSSRLLAFAFAGLALLLLLAGPCAADAPDDDAGPLLAFVKTAVANGQVEQSRVLGFNNPNKQFSETPDEGGVLIGFDLGLGKFFDIETVYALRAVYQTRHGDLRLQEHGLFRDKRLASGKMMKTRVLRTVHVQARPGYAVGGVTVRSGLNINGLSVTFMKIDGQTLDPLRTYTSDWVGDRTGGGEASIDGNGAPVVGVFGSQDEEHASALGLIYATPPAAAIVPPADPQPAVPPPAPPQPRPASVQPPVPPAEAPRPVEPPDAPVVQPKVESASTTGKTATPPAAVPEPGWPIWAAVGIPVAIFGAVAGVVFLFVLLPFGRKPKSDRTGTRPRAPAVAVSPSALSRKAGLRPRRRPARDEEAIIELGPEDIVPPSATRRVESPDDEEVIELGPEDMDPLPSPDAEPLLDVLPAEPPLEEARVGVTDALPAETKWPRLEL